MWAVGLLLETIESFWKFHSFQKLHDHLCFQGFYLLLTLSLEVVQQISLVALFELFLFVDEPRHLDEKVEQHLEREESSRNRSRPHLPVVKVPPRSCLLAMDNFEPSVRVDRVEYTSSFLVFVLCICSVAHDAFFGVTIHREYGWLTEDTRADSKVPEKVEKLLLGYPPHAILQQLFPWTILFCGWPTSSDFMREINTIDIKQGLSYVPEYLMHDGIISYSQFILDQLRPLNLSLLKLTKPRALRYF